jgi:hypothetical protein
LQTLVYLFYDAQDSYGDGTEDWWTQRHCRRISTEYVAKTRVKSCVRKQGHRT